MGIISPGRNWFSKVDAYILAAIQDGQRYHQRKIPLVWNNAGLYWAVFFRTLRDTPREEAALRYWWGRAEQSATDYGARHTYRWATLREWEVKSTTDVWRAAVAYGDIIRSTLRESCRSSIAYCFASSTYSGAYDLVRSPVLNPRTQPWVIAGLTGGIWVFWGVANQVGCRLITAPLGIGNYWVCNNVQ